MKERLICIGGFVILLVESKKAEQKRPGPGQKAINIKKDK